MNSFASYARAGMTNENSREYWDTCVFLRYLVPPINEKEEEQLERIEPMVEAAASGETLVIVSTMVLAEIRPRAGYDQQRQDVIDDLFYRGRRSIKVVGVTPVIAKMASQWGGENPSTLTVPDAIHTATAFLEEASVLYTLDGDSDKERRRSGKLLSFDGKLGDKGRKLRISIPPEPPEPTPEIQPSFPDGFLDETE